VIAEGLAQPPCRVVIESADGKQELAREHPVYDLLYRRPNDWQTSFEFREQLGFHLVLTGNAFVFINRRSDGSIIELLPYEPARVTVTRKSDLSIVYRLQHENGSSIEVPPRNIWHLRGPSLNGWTGLHAVRLARNAIGLSLAAEEFGSELFANGARASGYLETADNSADMTDEQIKRVREQWEEIHTGSGNRHKVAILNGLKWQQLSSTADEAQFIETRKFQLLEIARATRINPVMLMAQEGTAAFASIEQTHLGHVTHTLSPWWERFTQSAEVNLFTPAERAEGYAVKLYDNKMVRGTAKERAETNAILKQNGVITANQWLDELDLSRSDDAAADRLTLAVNLYGPAAPPAPAKAGA
jgi:HK97 family phage portal protein